MRRIPGRLRVAALLVGAVAIAFPATALARHPVPDYTFSGPAFGLATAPDGSLLVADAGTGIVQLRNGKSSLRVALPGVADMSPVGRGRMWAITGIGDPATEQPDSAWGVYTIHNGKARKVADLLDFEKAHNPDGNTAEDGIDSNPFDVEAISARRAVVADAGGNSLLTVDTRGRVDWIAAFPQELVSTANIKTIAGCPSAPPAFAFACGLPPMIPAQPVPTSVAIGPDGAFYVGELKGFPAPVGESRIWRIAPGTRHAQCGTDPRCSVVADGFTSIVDLELGRGGRLYVTEMDEASWAAVEFPTGAAQGGTVSACNIRTWSCSVVADKLSVPMATTVGKRGALYALTEALAGPKVVKLAP